MKFTQSLVAIAALTTLSSTLSFAGGDINPVTVFEQEPVSVPVEVPYVEPIPEPEYVAPVVQAPVVQTPIVTPPPAPEPKVEAKPLGIYLAGGLTDVAVATANRASLFKSKKHQDRQLGFTGRLGYDFMDYLGAELRGTYGFAKTDGSKFKQIGAYLKPNYNITKELNLYGLLGASKTNVGVGSTTGFSYGAGLDYAITDKVSVFTDVVNYMKKKGTASQWGLTLGAAYQF